MTNEEAICLLGGIQFDLTDGYYQRGEYVEAVCVFDRLNQENTKLKAENERLASDNSWLVLMKAEKEFENVDLLEERDKLKAEIEQLKKTVEYHREKLLEFNNDNADLKAEIEQWQSTNLKLVCELTRIECENHQLKSELKQSAKEKSEIISKIEYALNECEPIYNKCAVVPQAKSVYELAMNYCLDLLKGQV